MISGAMVRLGCQGLKVELLPVNASDPTRAQALGSAHATSYTHAHHTVYFSLMSAVRHRKRHKMEKMPVIG